MTYCSETQDIRLCATYNILYELECLPDRLLVHRPFYGINVNQKLIKRQSVNCQKHLLNEALQKLRFQKSINSKTIILSNIKV